MKFAADFRSIARSALRGKWTIAVIAGLLASLLGGTTATRPEFKLNFDTSGVSADFNIGGQTVFSSSRGLSPELSAILAGAAVYIAIAAVILAVVFFILGSVVELGYTRFNLDLIDGQHEPTLNTLFGYFPHWSTAAVTNLLKTVYIFLWSLLLVIPGIIAGYSYAMTAYILSEHPELTASEAIARSKALMTGNRWRLFCLQLSFIGWDILAALTMGIGSLWLTPYTQAATAAFYREISGTAAYPQPDSAEPWQN